LGLALPHFGEKRFLIWPHGLRAPRKTPSPKKQHLALLNVNFFSARDRRVDSINSMVCFDFLKLNLLKNRI
jgi:hypothetical protein